MCSSGLWSVSIDCSSIYVTKKADHLLKELSEGEGNADTRRGRIQTICSVLNDKKIILKELDEEVITLCNVDDIEHDIEESEEVMSYGHTTKYGRVGQRENRDENEWSEIRYHS